MSTRTNGAALWEIAWPGCPSPIFLVGTRDAVLAHINDRHRATGLEHAMREVQMPPAFRRAATA